jgi:hypothetical protein
MTNDGKADGAIAEEGFQATKEPVQFNPTLAADIDRRLEKIAYSISYALDDARKLIDQIETEHESLYDSEGQGPFPLCANLTRFESLFKWTFSESTMRLDKRVEELLRDWQLKLGTFNQTTGSWEYPV